MENTAIDLILDLGFPVAVAVGAGYFIWKIYWQQQADNREDKEKLYAVLAANNQTNKSILEANREMLDSNRELMCELKRDIVDIKEAVIK